jgi:hypothetical protein
VECKQAQARLACAVAEGADAEADGELVRHLQGCAACCRQAEAFRCVRDELRSMSPAAPPEQVEKIIGEGLAAALKAGNPAARAPADPRPARSGAFRAGVVVACLAGLALMTVAGLALFPGPKEAAPAVGEIAYAAGNVEIVAPGSSGWRPIQKRESLPAGCRLRTLPDALLHLQGEGVEWWLSGMTAIELTAPRKAELLAGRMFVQCTEAGGDAVTLSSSSGTVSSTNGAFVAVLSMRRLRVGCVSGTVQVEGGPESPRLGPGQTAMLVEGQVSGPVRAVRPSQLTHWLKLFTSRGREPLLPRQLAAVPLDAEAPALADEVNVDQLGVRAVVRGPLVFIRTTAGLRNAGPERWEGRLDLAGALLPVPVAATPPVNVSLGPGETGKVNAEAVCVMRQRSGCHALGFSLQHLTRQHVGEVRLDLEAQADGGIRLLSSPTMDVRERRPGPDVRSWSVRDLDSAVPLVVEFAFARREGLDTLLLGNEARQAALVAWRMDAGRDEWLAGDRPVFLAFDGGGEFDLTGRAAAHDVLEGLVGSLSPGCTTAALAYDGSLKLDPDRLMRHYPVRAEVMLERFWRLADDARPATRAFLAESVGITRAGEGEALLVFVTGRQGPGELTELAAAGEPGRPRLAVLQVGALRADPSWRALCAGTGGVAIGLPCWQAPDLAVLDFLANLQEPAVRSASVSVPAPAQAVLWAGPGDFANQPVVAVVALARQEGPLAGRLDARAQGASTSAEFRVGGESRPAVDSSLVDVLLRMAAGGPGCETPSPLWYNPGP